MKKFLKWFAISFSILLLLIVIAISVTIWFVFTPERLTPVIRKQAAEFITCKSEIGEVELTFFSTFPQFGLKISRFALINPLINAPSDTLVFADQLVGVIDVAAFWKRNEVVLTELKLQNANINVFTDSTGLTNFDIVKADTIPIPKDTLEEEMKFSFININNVEFVNINMAYIDNQLKLKAQVHDFMAQFSGFLMDDSLKMNLQVTNGIVTFSYDGENYLNNASVKMTFPATVNLSKERVLIENAFTTINDLTFSLNGTVQNDTLTNSILTNLSYKLDSWSIPKVFDMIPLSYRSYIEGMDFSGLVSSSGEIKGVYSDSLMPWINSQIKLTDGKLIYTDIPFPLTQMNGKFQLSTDLSNDAQSFLKINSFSAKTPKSFFKGTGAIKNLFSDIYFDIVTDANLTLSEFAAFIPSDMNMTFEGNANGRVKLAFKMSQLDNLQIDRMKISGSLLMKDFNARYDSMTFATAYSRLEFTLPNPNTKSLDTKYLYAKIDSKFLEAGMLDGTYSRMTNASLSLETSDVMDSTSLPNVTCLFGMDLLEAGMDTMNIAANKLKGDFAMVSVKGGDISNIKIKFDSEKVNAIMGKDIIGMTNSHVDANVAHPFGEPKIKLNYSGEMLDMNLMGNSVQIGKVKMNTDVVNDSTQKDIFQQWMATGFLEMEKGHISTELLRYPIEIPAIKMYFTPEEFNIKESRMKIANSDFSLSGKLSNILSYFKHDSLLRGNFSFNSSNTDILQLMILSSGIGDSSAVASSDNKTTTDSVSTGPYMVPKGMDLLLKANITRATLDVDTITNIKGDIRVKDGILLLDGLVFTTPAAKMQLTAMYRSPRKNHLYLGMDYHMLNIEIEELLKMIPDIDSMMPMLRSFRGKGEFHIAAETYLDSMYNPKKSTIRSAASIRGQDLVLMDGETFSEIAKTLRFSKRTKNKVDSLSAEFTVFKQEIDIYPFLIVMDKYKAVVAGRHNLDMSFDYHISLVDSPFPVKLGANVTGTLDDLKIRPAKCRYAQMYRPAQRGVVKNKQLELRRMIRESLVKKVIQD